MVKERTRTRLIPDDPRERDSHIRQRASHTELGIKYALDSGRHVAIQTAIDGTVDRTNIVPGSVTSGSIAGGSVIIEHFSTTVRPVSILTGTLPTLPSTSYPVGSIAFRTDDNLLYVNIGGVWTELATSSDPADDTQVWMPLTTVVGGVPELVWDGDDSLIPTLVSI